MLKKLIDLLTKTFASVRGLIREEPIKVPGGPIGTTPGVVGDGDPEAANR